MFGKVVFSILKIPAFGNELRSALSSGGGGFAYMSGHGIEQELVDEVFDLDRR